MSGGERRRQAPEPGASGGGSGVAVVLAGAGARGAYEAGSLSVILPALGASQPRLYVGTSAGAINAVGFAALSHLDPEEAGERALVLWRALRQRQVFHPPLATLVASTARRLMSGGRVRHRPVGLLDTAPLHRTLGRVLSWDQLHVNIRHGHVDACAVVATEKSSHSSAVFVQGGRAVPTPEADDVRGIRYLRSTLTPAHVVASSSLPALFPATAIEHSGSGRDHYVDGGVRLNTADQACAGARRRSRRRRGHLAGIHAGGRRRCHGKASGCRQRPGRRPARRPRRSHGGRPADADARQPEGRPPGRPSRHPGRAALHRVRLRRSFRERPAGRARPGRAARPAPVLSHGSPGSAPGRIARPVRAGELPDVRPGFHRRSHRARPAGRPEAAAARGRGVADHRPG